MEKALAKIIALALGLDANFFDKPETLGEPIAILRLLHYQGWSLTSGTITNYTISTTVLIIHRCCHDNKIKSQTPDKGYTQLELILTIV